MFVITGITEVMSVVVDFNSRLTRFRPFFPLLSMVSSVLPSCASGWFGGDRPGILSNSSWNVSWITRECTPLWPEQNKFNIGSIERVTLSWRSDVSRVPVTSTSTDIFISEDLNTLSSKRIYKLVLSNFRFYFVINESTKTIVIRFWVQPHRTRRHRG